MPPIQFNNGILYVRPDGIQRLEPLPDANAPAPDPVPLPAVPVPLPALPGDENQPGDDSVENSPGENTPSAPEPELPGDGAGENEQGAGENTQEAPESAPESPTPSEPVAPVEEAPKVAAKSKIKPASVKT